MKVDDAAAKRKMALAEEATAKGKVFFSKENGSHEFDRGCDHICQLLEDAFQLFQAASYPTAIFISISAIEEIAKLEIASFRQEGRTEAAKKRGQDHLFSHKAKHTIALQEVIAIGSRLPEAIGEERVRALLDMAESGKLITMREASLYFDRVEDTFVVPADRFSAKEAREVILLALEVWDDRLVGLTNHTYELDVRMMEIFKNVAES